MKQMSETGSIITEDSFPNCKINRRDDSEKVSGYNIQMDKNKNCLLVPFLRSPSKSAPKKGRLDTGIVMCNKPNNESFLLKQSPNFKDTLFKTCNTVAVKTSKYDTEGNALLTYLNDQNPDLFKPIPNKLNRYVDSEGNATPHYWNVYYLYKDQIDDMYIRTKIDVETNATNYENKPIKKSIWKLSPMVKMTDKEIESRTDSKGAPINLNGFAVKEKDSNKYIPNQNFWDLYKENKEAIQNKYIIYRSDNVWYVQPR